MCACWPLAHPITGTEMSWWNCLARACEPFIAEFMNLQALDLKRQLKMLFFVVMHMTYDSVQVFVAKVAPQNVDRSISQGPWGKRSQGGETCNAGDCKYPQHKSALYTSLLRRPLGFLVVVIILSLVLWSTLFGKVDLERREKSSFIDTCFAKFLFSCLFSYFFLLASLMRPSS